MTAFYPGAPPTRILSWSQMVREADPNYTRLSRQPWVYEFSNGRLFVDAMLLYSGFAVNDIADNGGAPILDNLGNWLFGSP